MKSVFKTVAPIAMTITFALSGAAMADTATAAAKSADSATAASTTTPAATTETIKPAAHHLHKSKESKLEQAETKNTVVPATAAADNSATAKPAAIDTAASTKVASAETGSKKVEPIKAK